MNTDSDTVLFDNEQELISELSSYLEVLGSPVRLRIIKLLEQKPMDARSLACEISTSYENTKKHIDRLLSIGVITKKAGLGRETSKGIHPVWLYSLKEGGLRSIARDLSLFSVENIRNEIPTIDNDLINVQRKVLFIISGGNPLITLCGGPDDGKVFPITQKITSIGRGEAPEEDRNKNEIILSPSYRAVTRIIKPHGRFFLENGLFFYSDEGSTGGSYLNNKRIAPKQRYQISDSDRIQLGEGTFPDMGCHWAGKIRRKNEGGRRNHSGLGGEKACCW